MRAERCQEFEGRAEFLDFCGAPDPINDHVEGYGRHEKGNSSRREEAREGECDNQESVKKELIASGSIRPPIQIRNHSAIRRPQPRAHTISQVNQATTCLRLLLAVCRLTPPRIVCRLCKSGLLWYELLLLAEEWVATGWGGLETIQSLSCRVDESPWGRMLGRNSQITDVAECILTLSSGEECVEAVVMGIMSGRSALRRSRSRRGLEVGDRVCRTELVVVGAELIGNALLSQGVQ